MAMRNPVTDKYEAKKLFKDTFEEVVGYGDSKDEAKADLKKKLKDYLIPGADSPGHKGRKYRPKLEVIGYINSPGFVAEMGEDDKVKYEYRADRKAQVFGPARLKSGIVSSDSKNLAESAKVETEGKE